MQHAMITWREEQQLIKVIAEAGSVMGWVMTSDAYFNKS